MHATVIDLSGDFGPALEDATQILLEAEKAVALSGAGISVESGIHDFRSPGGLWSVFAPGEYATLDVFLNDPEKAWKLYRALGDSLDGPVPNAAHEALARLEAAGLLDGVITQNIDGLHQAAGSVNVVEMHGDHKQLQCVHCGRLSPLTRKILDGPDLPVCQDCARPLKPNVVLFGESVRGLERIATLLEGCDLLLVVGTSALVHPAAGLPAAVKRQGGKVFEFNLEPTELTLGGIGGAVFGLPFKAMTDYFFHGSAGKTLPALAQSALAAR